LALTGRGAAGAVGADGCTAVAPELGEALRCAPAGAVSGAVCDSSGVASGSFEPLNRLKKLNMVWRGESERRCAQPAKTGGSGRQRGNAGCKALEAAHFIRRT
jgi:hypothetical protein